MKAEFLIDFRDGKEAGDALKVIQPQKGRNTVMHVLHKKGASRITYIIESNSFSPLRARSTSLLRDLKVMLAVFEKARKSTPK